MPRPRQADDRLSRLLSLILRHQPGLVGVTLDAEGWADVTELLDRLNAHGHGVTREQLVRLVATNNKQRFAFDESGARVRASQGHSMAVDLGLVPVEPPPVLYHGTARHAVESIRRDGLVPGTRQSVHLSSSTETAHKVGARHGVPAVLTVDSGAMHAAGHPFTISANGVWLVAAVPPEFIRWEVGSSELEVGS